MQHRIVFLDYDAVPVPFRRPAFAHDWVEYPNTRPDQVVERLREATIAVSSKVPLNRAALAQLPHLVKIGIPATGTNNVDLAYCRERGITVTHVRDYSTHAVSEHTFALILALRRNLAAYQQDLKAGQWQRSEMFFLFNHPLADLHGATLGIIGNGSLGQTVARLAAAFGMHVLVAEHKEAADVRPGYTAFRQVLQQSDVLSLHCPLTDATQNLIGAAELGQMKRDAILVNTARGGLVDEQALHDALVAGRIGGAGLDVLREEPPRAGNPLLDLELPNLIVTPHVAWASQNSMAACAEGLVRNLEAFVRGKPINVVC